MNPKKTHTPLQAEQHEKDRIGHEPGKSRDIIAKVELTLAAPAGEKSPVIYEIGTPYITLDGFWRAPIWIIGGVGDSTPEIYGLDSFQALYFAVERIRKNLTLLAGSGSRLLDREGREISPTDYFKPKD